MPDRVLTRRPDQREALRIGDERICRSAVSGHDDAAVTRARVVDEEAPAAPVVRRKRQAEQPLFAATFHQARDVQKRRALQDAVFDHADDTTLLGDELHRGVGRILDEGGRRREARNVGRRTELGVGRGGAQEEEHSKKGCRGYRPHIHPDRAWQFACPSKQAHFWTT